MGLLHSSALFGAHREGLVVRAGQALAGAQFGEDGLHVHDLATHPFKIGFLETLADERCPHLMVAKDAAVVAHRRLVQRDGVILDGGGLELLGHALLHVASGLAHLEQPVVRLIGDRISVDAWPGFRLGREDFFDGGFTHRNRFRGSSL